MILAQIQYNISMNQNNIQEIQSTQSSSDQQIIRGNTEERLMLTIQGQTTFKVIEDDSFDSNHLRIQVTPRQRTLLQIRMFLATYISFAILHYNRQSWAVLKPKLQKEQNVESSILGAIDTSFLTFYAIGLFINGQLSDRYDPKTMLIFAFFLVAGITILISMTALYQWVNPVLYTLLFAVNGLFQSVGRPCCNQIFANWFGKKGRGSLMGLWQSSYNTGNVAGAIVTSFLTSTVGMQWELSYMVSGGFCIVMAFVNMWALISHPDLRGIDIEEIDKSMSATEEIIRRSSIEGKRESNALQKRLSFHESSGISLKEALQLPGVLMYAACCFCIKFASFGFMLWLPLYVQKSRGYSDYETAWAVAAYDMGNVLGGVFFGALTDLTFSRRTPWAVLAIILATAFQVLLAYLPDTGKVVFFTHIFVIGILMGGVLVIISGIASADLGKQNAVQNNQRSVGTVIGIMWGIGTLGAAIGQVIIGFIEQHFGWDAVFIFMAGMVLTSALPLLRSVKREIGEIRILSRAAKESQKSSQ
ncbi:hypothetical protein FGO68_gene6337 [Halteria grandinella]|uniref:Major facilitator superfamily (MFS) profile domain-containing protein n=1 Tax=Halteria grandinella TaxID=5974 RepID=A0A8J8NTQ4_HALGN|nr:hypothetical protein FGO68_gene6337 [Halteria grandinella]